MVTKHHQHMCCLNYTQPLLSMGTHTAARKPAATDSTTAITPHLPHPESRDAQHTRPCSPALPCTTQEQGTPSTAPGPPTAPSTVPHLEPSARPQPRAHTGLLCTQTADIWKSLNIKIYSSVKAENNPCLAHDVALAFVSLNQC